VRYWTLDYTQLERRPDAPWTRIIEDETEWRQPSWARAGFDTLDFGLELETDRGATFTVSWDPPGDRDGVSIAQAPLRFTGSPIAIWDVTKRSRWSALVGQPVADVTLHYRPWGNGAGFWCSRISLLISGVSVHLFLGEGHAEDDPAVYLSGDNVAVVFPPTELPKWELGRTGS
jgi:hypothetical protein